MAAIASPKRILLIRISEFNSIADISFRIRSCDLKVYVNLRGSAVQRVPGAHSTGTVASWIFATSLTCDSGTRFT